jgi:hypothetical protein
MSGYAGHRRRAGRRIGARGRPGRRMGGSGRRRGLSRGDRTMVEDSGRRRDGPTMVEGPDPSLAGLTMARVRGRTRGVRTTVEDPDRSLAALTMARDQGRSRGDRTVVEDLGRNLVGLTMVGDPDLSLDGRITVLARGPNRADRGTAPRPNLGNRMAGRDRSLRDPIMVRDRSRTGRVVEDPRMGRRVSARVVPIRVPRAPTDPTNVSRRLSNR